MAAVERPCPLLKVDPRGLSVVETCSALDDPHSLRRANRQQSTNLKCKLKQVAA